MACNELLSSKSAKSHLDDNLLSSCVIFKSLIMLLQVIFIINLGYLKQLILYFKSYLVVDH